MKWRKLLFFVIAPGVAYPVTIIAANYFNKSFGIAVICSTFLYIVSLYFGTFQPSMDLHRDELLAVIRCVLTELDQRVHKKTSGNCMLRYNVMEIKGGLRNKYLKITVATPGHSEAELEIEWKKGYGTCGKAWRDVDQVIYDDQDAHRQKMTKTQEELTSKVKCVLSTPILTRTGKVRAILNIDSITDNVSGTCFDDEKVQQLAKTYAELLARIL